MSLLLILSSCSLFSGNTKKYNNAVADFYNKSQATVLITNVILSDYSDAWSSAIDNDDDFNTVLSDHRNSFDKSVKTVMKFKSTLSNDLKTITEAKSSDPKKYSEIYNESKKIYSYISSLVGQADSPTGSLISFNNNVNELNQNFNSEKDVMQSLFTKDINQAVKENSKSKE